MLTASETTIIMQKAIELGFDGVAILPAEPLNEAAERLSQWLCLGKNGNMEYLANNTEKRVDPRKLAEGTKSIIVTIISYKNTKTNSGSEEVKIASYAKFRDYHIILKEQLNKLSEFIKTIDPESLSRAFVDSAPIFERALAEKGGLGWIGRNSMLINSVFGTQIFISELLTTTVMDYTLKPLFSKHGNSHEVTFADFCKTCGLCIRTCPTGAICDNKTIDARLCISYHTTENRGEIPQHILSKMQNNIIGCDICTTVCPYHKRAIETDNTLFTPNETLINTSTQYWLNMSGSQFKKQYYDSPLYRVGLKKIKQLLR